ncbi:hypothetical protein HK104_007427, partial [Borealophlyctis nickersoniae]
MGARRAQERGDMEAPNVAARIEGGVGVGAGIGSSQAANVADLRDLPNEETEDDWVTAHAEPVVPARVQHVSAPLTTPTPLTTRRIQAPNITGGLPLNAREENLEGEDGGNDEESGDEGSVGGPPEAAAQFATMIATVQAENEFLREEMEGMQE